MLTRSRMIVVLLFILAFGAGLSVARVMDHRRPEPPERGPSWLAGELNLSPEQRQSMLTIWGGLNNANSEDGDRRRELVRQRNEAIRKLIPEDQQHLLAQINEEHNRQMSELSNQRRRRFEEAVEKTKAMLNADQRQKYERILQRQQEERRRGGRPDRPRREGQQEVPASQPPATQPAV